MDEQNFYPFYLNLFAANIQADIKAAKDIEDKNKTEDEWQQEYELINISHLMENGW
jgi:hypothetical protein